MSAPVLGGRAPVGSQIQQGQIGSLYICEKLIESRREWNMMHKKDYTKEKVRQTEQRINDMFHTKLQNWRSCSERYLNAHIVWTVRFIASGENNALTVTLKKLILVLTITKNFLLKSRRRIERKV